MDSRTFDFGKLYSRTPVSHRFVLTNNGNRTLKIKEIKYDCGCSASFPDDCRLDPGLSCPLEVTLTPDISEGNIERSITVYFDVPESPNWVELTVKAEMTTLLKLDPPYLYFKKVYFGEGATEQITITAQENSGIMVTSADVMEGKLNLELIPESSERQTGGESLDEQITKWTLKLTLPPETPAGRFAAKVAVHTNSELQPTVIIPVYGFVRGQVSIVPTQCYFGILHPGETKEQVISIRKKGEPTLTLPTIECSIPNLNCNLETVESGRLYKLHITTTVSENSKGKLTGEITIHTNDPTQPEFTLPVFGYIIQNVDSAPKIQG